MSIETIIKYKCDVCKNEIKQSFRKPKKMQVIFETEQTEGRATKPYLEIVDIDICVDCLGTALGGKTLFAEGAQGHNTYYFKGSK